MLQRVRRKQIFLFPPVPRVIMWYIKWSTYRWTLTSFSCFLLCLQHTANSCNRLQEPAGECCSVELPKDLRMSRWDGDIIEWCSLRLCATRTHFPELFWLLCLLLETTCTFNPKVVSPLYLPSLSLEKKTRRCEIQAESDITPCLLPICFNFQILHM